MWWEPDASKSAHSLLLKAAHTPTFVRNAEEPSSVDVCAAPQRKLGIRWKSAHHRYCEQAGGTSRGELMLRLWGYGDQVKFDKRFTVRVSED